MRFDHLGVVVRNMARGRSQLAACVGVEAWTQEFRDPVNGVIAQFGRDGGGVCYELLEPLGDDSPVKAALTSRRAILNHVAYLVPDLTEGAARLRDAGCAATADPKPAIAYGGRRIQFFVTPLHFVMELIEAPNHEHAFSPEAHARGGRGLGGAPTV